MNGEIYHNLMEMMGKENPYNPQETLSVNSSNNDLIFCYLYFYCSLGQMALKPNLLPSIQAIDRVIRDLPNREKNLTEQERYRKYYAGI